MKSRKNRIPATGKAAGRTPARKPSHSPRKEAPRPGGTQVSHAAPEPGKPAVSAPHGLAWISRHFAWVAGALILLAGVLRCYHLGMQEVWLDEAFSALLVERPAMLPLLQAESNPPLYWLLLKVFCTLFGTSPAALRALSALFGTATVAVVTLYGARVFSRPFALGAGLFVAVSPYALYYSQEARAYSLLILLSVLILLSCYDAVIRRSRSAVRVFAVAVVAAGFTHYFVALTLLPVAFWLGARWTGNPDPQERVILRKLLLALAAAAAVCAVWVLPTLQRQGASDPHLWIADQWKYLDKAWIVPRSILVLLLGSAQGLTPLFMKQWTLLPQAPGFVSVVLIAYAVILGLAWFGARREGAEPLPGRLGILLVIGVVLPLGVLLGISFIKPLYVIARYDVVAFAYVVLLAGWIADRSSQLRLRSIGAALAAGAVFLTSLGYKDLLYYQAPAIFQDYDAATSAELIDKNVRQSETVVFTGMRGPSVLYYLSARGYEWDGRYCHNVGRPLTFECRILPYTDAGVPFVMGGKVTTPVTANTAVADLEPVLTREPRSSLWLVVTRDREPINDTINRHVDVLLHRNRYFDHGLPPELRRYQILKFQPTPR